MAIRHWSDEAINHDFDSLLDSSLRLVPGQTRAFLRSALCALGPGLYGSAALRYPHLPPDLSLAVHSFPLVWFGTQDSKSTASRPSMYIVFSCISVYWSTLRVLQDTLLLLLLLHRD